MTAAAAALAALLSTGLTATDASKAPAQQPRAQAPAPAAEPAVAIEQLHDAIDHLGAFDDLARMKASSTVRRADGPMAVAALLDAVDTHRDGYVRYRALVLLTGFKDPRIHDAMAHALEDPNDRLRAVGYEYFEHHPDPSLLPSLLAALDKETAEFVRPSLVRALAAQGSDPKVQQALMRDVSRGQDFFRSTVIEALGDYKAAYAVKAISGVAALDGPLQDDAALALGKIGDKASLGVLAGLQHTAPKEAQPVIAAAICLLGVNCDTHRGYLIRTLTFTDKIGGYQELLRSAATGLGAIAESGDTKAVDALLDLGDPAREPARAPLALATATVAVRKPALLLDALGRRHETKGAIDLLADGFAMLEEDYAEETFFAAVRHAYWAAPEGSEQRRNAQALIRELGF